MCVEFNSIHLDAHLLHGTKGQILDLCLCVLLYLMYIHVIIKALIRLCNCTGSHEL